MSRPSSAPDAKAFPLRSFQLDLSLFSQRLVREFLVLFENYAGFTKIEIVCHPASFRMLFHNQFVSSVSPQRNLSVALLAFVTLFSFQGADRRPQAFACLRHSFQPLLQSDLKIRSFDQVFKSKQIAWWASGLEPPTLRLSVVRSSQLSYGPSSWTR